MSEWFFTWRKCATYETSASIEALSTPQELP